jgi:hypothetical protein
MELAPKIARIEPQVEGITPKDEPRKGISINFFALIFLILALIPWLTTLLESLEIFGLLKMTSRQKEVNKGIDSTTHKIEKLLNNSSTMKVAEYTPVLISVLKEKMKAEPFITVPGSGSITRHITILSENTNSGIYINMHLTSYIKNGMIFVCGLLKELKK